MARTYADRCGIARTLDVVGDRWSLLIVRELVLGPKRYRDLQAGLAGISPDVLSARLRDLEAAGVLKRSTLPPPAAAAKAYALTQRGHALEPTLRELGRWGSVEPPRSAQAELGVDAAMVALQTLFTDGPDVRVQLEIAGQPFRAEIRDHRFELARGEHGDPDATIAADPGALARVLWHDGDPAAIHIDGDSRAAARFMRAFPLPGQAVSVTP